jgi:hypothetical protein
VDSGGFDPGELEVNIKGYVNDAMNNTGEDRGYLVDTSNDFWAKYSLDKKDMKYPVIASKNKTTAGSMIIQIEDSFEKTLIVESENKNLAGVRKNGEFLIDQNARYFINSVSGVSLLDIKSGFFSLECNGKKIEIMKTDINKLFDDKTKKIKINLLAGRENKKQKICDFTIRIKEN